jgi:hypothetical protein
VSVSVRFSSTLGVDEAVKVNMFYQKTEEYGCGYLVTKGTIVLGSEERMIPPTGIPHQGLCSVHRDGQFYKPCDFPLSKESCHLRRFSDFCQEPWAR